MEGRFLIPQTPRQRRVKRRCFVGLILGLPGLCGAMTAAAAAGWIHPLFSGWLMGVLSGWLGWKLGKA